MGQQVFDTFATVAAAQCRDSRGDACPHQLLGHLRTRFDKRKSKSADAVPCSDGRIFSIIQPANGES